MDFDDLDDAIDQAVAAGEQVAGFARTNNQPKQGTELEPMPRTGGCPPDRKLPERVRATLPPRTEPCKDRHPKVRLLAFYGAGDSIPAGWAAMAHDAPEDVEMATYEWPGHGTREEEPLLDTLDGLRDDAFESFKEAMDTGTFAVLGHSIGCLIATAVCERAQRELGVKPVCAIMLERAPPHIDVLSPKGTEMRREDPKLFLEYYCGAFVAGLGGQHGVDMWQNDMALENDNRPVGFYRYPCPLLSVCALNNYFEEKLTPEIRADPKVKADLETSRSIRSRGTTFNFSREHFKEWADWLDNPALLEVLYVESDHYGVKTHAQVRCKIWDALKKAIDLF